MIVREAIRQIHGFRYMTEKLDICSSLGRQCLMERPWMTLKEEIEKEYSGIEEMIERREKEGEKLVLKQLEGKLREVMDIRGTVKRLAEQAVLEDPELFEIKNFALIIVTVREWVKDWSVVDLPDLMPVVDILDPEKARVPHFYVYDIYSPELAALRNVIRSKREQGAPDEERDSLYFEAVELEDQIRRQLTEKLITYRIDLRRALEEIACLDIFLAKARQVQQMGLVRPVLSESDAGTTKYQDLFNPPLREILWKEQKEFQTVDMELYAGTSLITGANMAGKTVLLKTVALAQCLAQFGFFVPAGQAEIVLVESIALCIGDEQDEMSGLSSFAAEMFRIDSVLREIREKKKLLVLVDEPARTTNPSEGKAIVNGLVELLTFYGTRAMITTHYGGITASCRKWRVRGFRDDRVNGELIVKNLNDYIDYSLERDNSDEVPHEAIRIARILGIDEGLLQAAEHFMKEGQEPVNFEK